MQNQNSKFRKYLETIVNLSLIIACLTFVGVLAKSYFVSPTAVVKKVQTGNAISFSDFSWKK